MYTSFTTQVDPTRNPSDGVAHAPFYEYVNYVNADDTATYYGMATAANPVTVIEVIHTVKTAFGGSATIDVGDGSTADLWIANTSIDENTAPSSFKSTVCKRYTAPFQVKVTLGGTRTGGTGQLIVGMLRE
jgi:hypothetical protein